MAVGTKSGFGAAPATLTASSTFVDVLRAHAEDAPDAEAFTFLDHDESEAARLSFGELDRRARALAARFQALGLGGERALLVYPPGFDCVAALYGCFYAGVVAVPSPPPDPGREHAAPRIRTLVRDARPRAVLTTAAVEPDIRTILAGVGDDADRVFFATDDDEVGVEEDWRPPSARPEDVALVQYTSGATSVPRGVMTTHANLIANCELIARSFEHSRALRGVIWLPPYHDMGLIGGIFEPVYCGGSVTLMSPVTFLLDPMSWLRAISRYRATTSGGPNFAFELCVRRSTPEQREGLDLSSWDLAFNGAELVRRETIDAFCDAFEPAGFRREAFYPCYGLAEATLMVTGGEKVAAPVALDADPAALERGRFVAAESAPGAMSVVGCGRSGPEGRVVIADPDTGVRCDDGWVGEIWLSGPSVARGYWDRDEETAATFGASLADTGEGPFLRTGDLGFVFEGELFVTGRISEVIVANGRAYYPTDIERACEGVPGVRRGGAAAFMVDLAGRDRLAIVHEARDDGSVAYDDVIAGVRDAISEKLGLDLGAVVLIAPRTLPRTTSGKVQRARCRTLFLTGELSAVARWPDAR